MIHNKPLFQKSPLYHYPRNDILLLSKKSSPFSIEIHELYSRNAAAVGLKFEIWKTANILVIVMFPWQSLLKLSFKDNISFFHSYSSVC